MIPPPIRPTFEHAVCMDQEALIARLRSAFEGHDEHYPNQILPAYCGDSASA